MTLTDRLRAHLLALIGARDPVTSPDALRSAEDYLTGQFQRLGLDVSFHPFQALVKTYRNVIAAMPASPRTAPQDDTRPLIVAAHYDTVPGSPGADENASGLAVMLEVARSLRAVPLGRSLRFIGFCLEEREQLGSLAYASSLREAGQDILGAIVLECVGYACSEEGSQFAPAAVPIAIPSTGDFLGIIGNTASAELAGAVDRAMNRHVPDLRTVSLLVPGQGERLPDTRRSDHAAFWAHGYPALMLTDTANFRNPHYHQASDTLATLDLAFLRQVAEAVTAAALDLAGTDMRPGA